ncbi:cyclic nucleotide-binding domain protein (macronuclear) [Tetrahymena thermophila SB210]|uniref:Cyclic nucleotide-binding domain protein n=1 Tax=Tetrahymena thermophila (strain SB210) TaxID=312017 RepID=I7MH86_TETTS|nr:cyclic nucleotide-binding domain protein [Tetrahymena thermophila SB210]EAS02700.2 cyclic nucleotide-binding domain protein [Tetrahymena thermophila SB210]|eukprot:XP_001022945.2 cyclic nucleotide-binding domain protein [Tetrahymena thermophila SB210]
MNEHTIRFYDIEKIIQIPPSERNVEEIQQLGQYMRNNFQIFECSSDEIISSYLEKESIKQFNLRDIIQKIYTMCYSFYCIAEGQVGLYIKTIGEKSQMNLVKVIEQGEYFGTYNLIQNSPQTMQSICESSQATLIEISKDFFDKYLKENEEKIIAQGINQFKKMPLFKNHPYYILKNIYLSSFEVKLVKNNYVFKENDDIHAIYVIKKGDFSIYKSFDWDQKQSNQIYLKKASFCKQVKLSVMVEGQIFGEEDLVQGKQNRSYTAICDSSDGELYVIRSQVFLQKIYNNNFSKRTIQELLKQKNALFSERMETIQKQYIEKQSPQYCKTQPDKEDGEKTVQVVNPALATKESSEKNIVQQQQRVQTASSNMSRTSRGQFYSPIKVAGEYEKIMERRMSPFKQLENSLFGNKEDLIYESRNIDNKIFKIIGNSPSPKQQSPPKPQTDMFSIEIDEKQKILLKQKQQQYYQYKNYLKNFESDKFNELLKKSGYKMIDKNTVEKKQGIEYDFIKIRPSMRLKSLDNNFQYFYGPDQQPSFNNFSNSAISNASSKQRVSNLNDQFQIKLQQNGSNEQFTNDYIQYQSQLKDYQEDGQTPFLEEQLPNDYQLTQMYANYQAKNQDAVNIEQQPKQSNIYNRFQAQRGQLVKQDNNDLDNNNMILEIDPNYDGEIQINTLFQNDALKNKNIAPDPNLNYVITEIEEEDRVSTQQSNQRKLKTESYSSNYQQDYLFQQSTRQNTLSPARGEKSLLIDSFENSLINKDELYLFNQRNQYTNKSETHQYINDNINQGINLNRSFNTVDNNQILMQKQNNYNFRSQSTRKQRIPLKKSQQKQIEPIYNKEYINQQLKKFTLSNNNQKNEDYLVPNLTDSYRKYNGYKLPSVSQGQSRKNSPPLSPSVKSRVEQRLSSFKQDLKKNIFLQLHLNSYEQNLNTDINQSMTVKRIQKLKNNLF